MPRNRIADLVRSGESRISIDMRITLRGLRLAVTEQLADKRQRHSGANTNAGRCMSEIVEAYVAEVSGSTKPTPGLCEVDERLAVMSPLDDVVAGAPILPMV